MPTNGKGKTRVPELATMRVGISEWSGGERSEPPRNGEIPTPKNGEEEGVPPTQVTPPERRRRFTAAYKVQIVREAETCLQPGEIGTLLRREGLYSSQLTAWRKLYRQGVLNGLVEIKRGRKPQHVELEKENERLRRRLERAEQDLQRAHLIIEAQKKFPRSWELPKRQSRRTRTANAIRP